MTIRYIPFLVSLCVCFMYSCCCCDEDVYHLLPYGTGRYYENSNSLTFYCPETDLYETFEICFRGNGFIGNEIRDTYCSDYVDYRENKDYKLDLDSCGTERYFYLIYEELNPGLTIVIRSYYENIYHIDIGGITTHTNEMQSIKVNGITYDDVHHCTFYSTDSLKSALVSMEYGIIQYSFENVTFSLVNDENP